MNIFIFTSCRSEIRFTFQYIFCAMKNMFTSWIFHLSFIFRYFYWILLQQPIWIMNKRKNLEKICALSLSDWWTMCDPKTQMVASNILPKTDNKTLYSIKLITKQINYTWAWHTFMLISQYEFILSRRTIFKVPYTWFVFHYWTVGSDYSFEFERKKKRFRLFA